MVQRKLKILSVQSQNTVAEVQKLNIWSPKNTFIQIQKKYLENALMMETLFA